MYFCKSYLLLLLWLLLLLLVLWAWLPLLLLMTLPVAHVVAWLYIGDSEPPWWASIGDCCDACALIDSEGSWRCWCDDFKAVVVLCREACKLWSSEILKILWLRLCILKRFVYSFILFGEATWVEAIVLRSWFENIAMGHESDVGKKALHFNLNLILHTSAN